ncbi:MAG TPA: hypothetical protein VK140_15605 [Ktedonobacteraceae bacterium]|nr:hypothetical protein [Ktedonobacteraceae bacterium]
MAKIHIVGGPGSGKTTLAQDLSSRFHVPHYDLDKVNWEKENVIAIAEQPAWVTEGIYLIWTEPMLYHADCIVLLEISWPVAAWRILHRHISKSLRGTNPYHGINGVKALFKLLTDTRSYLLNEESSDIPTVDSMQTFFEKYRDISEPPTEEFVQMFFEKYQDISEPPTAEFVRIYLEKYKEKVFFVRNSSDRERLLELLTRHR